MKKSKLSSPDWQKALLNLVICRHWFSEFNFALASPLAMLSSAQSSWVLATPDEEGTPISSAPWPDHVKPSFTGKHLLTTLNCKEGWEMWFLVMLLHAQLQILIHGREKTDFRENCEALPYEVNFNTKFLWDNHHFTQGVF